MKKYGVLIAVIALGLLSGPSSQQARQASDFKPEGLRALDLRRFADSLRNLQVPILAIRFLRIHGLDFPGGIAILLPDQQTGWQIQVYTRRSNQAFRLEWRSERLDQSFVVSSYDRLRTYSLGNEEVLVFDGCAARACPDAFGILVYVPSKRTAFWARRTYTGTVEFSPGLELPENETYKDWLDTQIANRLAVSR